MAVSQKPIILDETGQKIATNIATHTTKIEELLNKHNKVFVGEGAGLVPASESGEVSKFLRSDGHWVSLDGFSTVTTLPSSTTTQQPILLHSIAQAGSKSSIEEVLFVSGVNVVPSTKSLNVGGTTTTNALTVTNNTTTKTLTSTGGITNTGNINQTGDIVVTGNVYTSNDGEFGGTVSSLALSTGNISATKVTSLGEVIGNTHFRVAASNGIPDLIIRNDGSNVYFLFSDYTNGSWNSLRPLTMNIATGNLSSSSTFTATKVYNAVWNDYAEFFPRGEETEVGDFVALSLDSEEEVYVKASKETSKSVGVHSNTFGHLIGGVQPENDEDFVEYNLPKFIPVGLVGRCYAKVIGCVKKGDFIVISDIPGVGRAFDKSVDSVIDIIGMACETSESEEIKLVKVKVGN